MFIVKVFLWLAYWFYNTIAFSRSSPLIIFLFKFVGNSREPFLDLVKTSQPLTHANINFNLIFSHGIRMRIRFVWLIWLTDILKGKIFHFCVFFNTEASVFPQPGLTQTLESLCRALCYKRDDHYKDLRFSPTVLTSRAASLLFSDFQLQVRLL